MNLFDLFVRIGVEDEVSEQIVEIGGKLKNGLATAGKVAAAGIGAATTAVGALAKASVEGYAETEQLRGGVETLFKTSADTVMAYAENAYKTAGMSANEYMSTVTSFSASLLQSLGGDTDKAAQMADMAITDMSDNANKMGTDMTMIQNAYNGFAKQNFTMLDNLKLGYGGTQKEMQRLLEDAEKLSGIEYDISSYADIVDAIHVIQTEMGITGTTAAEAEATISGSAASMRAAWENLLSGLADGNAEIDVLLFNFIESVKTVAGNVVPVVGTVLSNIGTLLMERGPEMIANGALLIGKLAVGAVEAIPEILSKIPEIVTSIIEAFSEKGPEFVEIGRAIVQGIWEGIQSLGSWIGDKVSDFFGGVVDGAKDLLGIHSPSRVFAGIGENMALGVGAGWDAEYQNIKNGITSGLDFGTGSVDFKSSAMGAASRTTASAASFGGEIVVEAPVYVGGSVVARNQYRFNLAEAQRRGNNLVTT